MHPAALPDEELLAQCGLGRGRASGPGGQHRNKVETAVTIAHRPTGVSAQASERRSQIENKRVALRRLRLKLAIEIRTHPSPPATARRGKAPSAREGSPQRTSSAQNPDSPGPSPRSGPASFPTDLWISRRHGAKIACNPAHHDYPALLAEALDAIAAAHWDPAPAAKRLGVSTSQLIKLVKDHPPAFVKWNTERAALHAHVLR